MTGDPMLANVFTGDDLMRKEFPSATVGDLLETGECTPMCITAAGPDQACICPCSGLYHGAARGVVILQAWPETRSRHDAMGCHWSRLESGQWEAAIGGAIALSLADLHEGWGPLTLCRCEGGAS